MRHSYYQKSKKEQLKIQVLIAFLAIALIIVGVALAFIFHTILLGILVLIITITLWAPFIDTPSMVKSKKLTYHSLFFLSEKPNNNIIQIHGGTLFDYVFAIPNNMSKKSRKHFIIQQYLEGLLNLITMYEDQPEKAFIIRGTSYIINAKTAKKLGFQVKDAEGFQLAILMLNYLQITCANTVANGKLTFPNVFKTRMFEADLQSLIAHKAVIASLHERLK